MVIQRSIKVTVGSRRKKFRWRNLKYWLSARQGKAVGEGQLTIIIDEVLTK